MNKKKHHPLSLGLVEFIFTKHELGSITSTNQKCFNLMNWVLVKELIYIFGSYFSKNQEQNYFPACTKNYLLCKNRKGLFM